MQYHHFKCEGREALHNNTTRPTPSMAVGLRILIQTSHTKTTTTTLTIARPNGNGAVVTKPKTLSGHTPSAKRSQVNQTCFLQSCHLCNKVLRPDKDVYMYRGDLGFCSIECRERQIVVDEMKELEKSTKKMLASSRHCYSSNGGRLSETRLLREELRRRNQVPVQKTRPVFS